MKRRSWVTIVPLPTLYVLWLTFPLTGYSGNLWLFIQSTQSEQLASILETNTTATIENSSNAHGNDRQKAPITPSRKRGDCAFSIGIGYRYDQFSQHNTPKNPHLQRIKWKYQDINSVMAIARIDARYRNWLFTFEGDYSPLISANSSVLFNVDPTVERPFHFKFNHLSGYEADAMASIGYRFLFLNDHSFRAAILFQVGYRYSHQSYETTQQSLASNTPSFVSILHDQTAMHAEWFGPFLEARLSLSYCKAFYFQPFYQYHLLDHRVRQEEAQKVYFYEKDLVFPSDFLVTLVTKNNHARGQLSGFDFYYQQQKGLRVGLKGAYLSFGSNQARTKTRIKEVSLNINPPTSTTSHLTYHAHTKWTSYSIAAYAGYNF